MTALDATIFVRMRRMALAAVTKVNAMRNASRVISLVVPYENSNAYHVKLM